jgi:ATP-dependent Clp protease ATP-binding subunit ClpX
LDRRQKRAKKRNIGELFAETEPEDLIKYGLIPELVGRLPVSCALDDLDEDVLLRILTEPKNAITKQYRKLFEMDGVDLTFEAEALRRVVDLTTKKGTGARGLRSVLEDIMIDLMYDIPSNSDLKEVVVTEETILNRVSPRLQIQKVKSA